MIELPEKPPYPILPKYRFFPLGDGALTVECENLIDFRIGTIARSIAAGISRDGFPGFIEAVPAMASATIYYDSNAVLQHFSQQRSPFEAVKKIASNLIDQLICVGDPEANQVEIPVSITPQTAPDLSRLADLAELSEEDVIDIFLSGFYRVYMLGFLPGFAYMAEVDDRIAAPRLETPRTKVPKGSIGIAGKQTGIYPLESPGGWNLIGQTDLQMFDPESDHPCILKPGDEVRFVQC